MNLVELIHKFADEDKCRSYLEALRWPKGVECPKCKAEKVYRILKRDQFVCDSCSHQFSVTSGTIFHDTRLPLWKWLVAVYLIAEAKKGISACQMQRTLKVSYKTAWYLCHRIRKAMTEVNPLQGTDKLDETWIGGKHRWGQRARLKNKWMVLGATERGGPLRIKMEARSKNPTSRLVRQWIKETTAPDAKRIMTDGHPTYVGINDHDTAHETVDHAAKEYVRGDVHTNSIESAWALFKHSIVGSYHRVSTKHLGAYLDEFEWRFNNRKNPYLFRDTVLKLITSPNLEYKKLTETAA
jgi:transposase-like protein